MPLISCSLCGTPLSEPGIYLPPQQRKLFDYLRTHLPVFSNAQLNDILYGSQFRHTITGRVTYNHLTKRLKSTAWEAPKGPPFTVRLKQGSFFEKPRRVKKLQLKHTR